MADIGMKIKGILKDLSRGKTQILEESVLARLDTVKDSPGIDRPRDASLSRYLTLIRSVNRTILREHSKIDRIFARNKDEHPEG